MSVTGDTDVKEAATATTASGRTQDSGRGPRSPGSARHAAFFSLRRVNGRTVRALERLPLRTRLVALLVILMIAALTLTTAVTSAVLYRQLLENTDRDLRIAAVPVLSVAFQQILQNRSNSEDFPTNYAVVVMPTDGSQPYFIPSSRRLKPHPVTASLAPGDERVRSHTLFDVPSSDGGPAWRMVAYYVPALGTVAVAASLDPVEDTVDRLITLETLTGLAVIAAFALIGWYAVRRAFRPLTAIEDTASAIAAGDLTRRVPATTAQDEVSSLSRSLNSMLSQVESSFLVREASEERMREFVADASHELRTPLAAVRGYAELYRQGAVRDPEQVGGAMRRIEDEAIRMGGLVEDLLLLTRLERRRTSQDVPVDLTVLAADSAQDARAIAPSRSIRVIGLDGPLRPTMVFGEEARLRQVVTNLLANAIHHTPDGTAVEIAVGTVTGEAPGGGTDASPGVSSGAQTSVRSGPAQAGHGARTEGGHRTPGSGARAAGMRSVLEVRDHGHGVDPANARKVFERFFRADPSRVRGAGGGSGLGLAIVAAIVAAHDGKVGIAPTPAGGATFVLDLPAVIHDPSTGSAQDSSSLR